MTERAKLRVQALRENQIARGRYLDAISTLRELRIFDILREHLLDRSSNRIQGDPNIDRLYFYKMMGYTDCLEDLQSLMDAPVETDKWELDFGARESLKEQGYTEEEIIKMLGEE